MGGPLTYHPLISLGIQTHRMPLCHGRSFTAPALQFHRHTILTSRPRAPVELFTLTLTHTLDNKTNTFCFSLRKCLYYKLLFPHWVSGVNSWHQDESKYFYIFFLLKSCVVFFLFFLAKRLHKPGRWQVICNLGSYRWNNLPEELKSFLIFWINF